MLKTGNALEIRTLKVLPGSNNITLMTHTPSLSHMTLKAKAAYDNESYLLLFSY